MTHTQNRCGIYVDIEGTSNIYNNNEIQFYQSLDCLLSSALQTAGIQFPKDGNRLLLHQMGADGLFMISDFGYGPYDIPISISIFLMQKLLLCGSVGKCGISMGDNADIRSCLPVTEELTKSLESHPRSGGFMTRVNIMGSALINAYRVADLEPRGSRLAVDRIAESLIPSSFVTIDEYDDIVVIDWIHTESPMLDHIYDSVDEHKPDITQLEDRLVSYVSSRGELRKGNWGRNTLSLNGCER